MSRVGPLCLAVLLGACRFDGAPGTPDMTVVPPDGDPDASEPDAGEPDAGEPDAPACAVRSLAANGQHTCAILTDGTLHCWGRNDRRQLGVASTQSCATGVACSATPLLVPVAPASVIGLGVNHGCATTTSGTVCWGDNTNGAFGDGSTGENVAPKVVPGRAGAASIAGGVFHTCSATSTSVVCSGLNRDGEVGDGSTTRRLTTTTIAATGTQVAASDFTSCVSRAGSVTCWGANAQQQLDATGQDRLVPTVVSTGAMATQVVLGQGHRCTLFEGGMAECRGSNRNGELGNGMISGLPTTTFVDLSSIAQLSASASHTCARTVAGEVYCFGYGYTRSPQKIELARPARDLASGFAHDCAILDDGALYCWGDSQFGQTGNGMIGVPRTLVPQRVPLCP